jgi:hypothetical protein
MKKIMAAVVLIVFVGCVGMAQEGRSERTGSGYVFVAPGAIVESGDSAALWHFGAGGQGFVYKGIGLGAEIGYLAPGISMAEGIGIFSANGLYEFRQASIGRKIAPFVTAGYSMAFRGGSGGNALNLGGGINYWFRARQALRLEVRDYITPLEPNLHILTARIGLSFR